MNMETQKKGAEHPTSAIFSRSDRLYKDIRVLCGDVECIQQALSGADTLEEPEGKAEVTEFPLLEDVKFRFDDHIRGVAKIQEIVSTIKASLINAPKIEGSG